ncbi:hypothetical protein ACFLXI_10175 [Chloroflexota bacterium]
MITPNWMQQQILRGGFKANQLTIELRYTERRRIHQLKYFTWVEQQGRTYDEIQAQWYQRDYWNSFQNQISEIDELIEEFNDDVGLD